MNHITFSITFFLGSVLSVIHPGAGSQPWSPSLCLFWLKAQTSSQLLPSDPRSCSPVTPAPLPSWETVGPSLPAAVGAQAVSLTAGCQALVAISAQELWERRW